MSNEVRAPEDMQPGSIYNLERFLDVVEQMDMGPLDHLTCTEVEALASLMCAHRGPEKGQWVIIHHFWDSDEELDELAAHLERWPDLRATLRRAFSEDSEIIVLLNELEEEGR